MTATCVDENVTAKDIRANCLECSGDSAKAVTWCSCDGLHSTLCRFWKARFGMRPATFRARFGDRLLTPEMMPPANVELERLLTTWEQAATAEIDIPGYHQPAVKVERSKSKLSEEQRQKLAEQLRRNLGKPR